MFINKILFKYIHPGSCFEEFIVRNIMVQSEFNLDTQFNSYSFFYLVENDVQVYARKSMKKIKKST